VWSESVCGQSCLCVESGSVFGLSLGQSCPCVESGCHVCDRGGNRIGLQATGSYTGANIFEGRTVEVLNKIATPNSHCRYVGMALALSFPLV
jgi:hypothetical protein